MSRDRMFHLLTFVVAAFAVVLQLVLVIQGHNVLDEENRPDAGTRPGALALSVGLSPPG